MPSRIKTLLALVGVVTIGALTSLFLLEPRQESKPADIASCAVYRGFYDHVGGEKNANFFRPTTRPYNRNTRSFYSEVSDDKAAVPTQAWRDYIRKWSQFVPRRFERDTGEFKLVQTSPKTKPYKKPIRQAFEKDASGFFEPLLSRKAISLERCFDAGSHRPKFYDGSFGYLRAREQLLGRADNWSVVIHTVSPVGFSEDGRHAMLYAEYYCNALCAGGAFYLFEMRGGTWTVIGDNWIWVS